MDRAQADAWKRIVDFSHRHSDAKLCMQLGHAGRKGSTQVGWERMDDPLDEVLHGPNWDLVAPSPVAVSRRRQRDAARDDAA